MKWRTTLFLVFFISIAQICMAQTITVQGKVTDSEGTSLPGANVSIKNTTTGTITNLDGEFSIDVPPDGILTVSYVGFTATEIEVNNRTALNIVLDSDNTQISEVVVVGYGVQKKETVVGSISQAKGEDLLKAGTPSSISQSLQGLMPGVTGVVQTGQPGSENANLTIRGISSWQGDGAPLILVDGIERNMNEVDPNEIQSISVLKDASATAVFGVKGGDGVILITTKRGTDSGTKINFSTNVGFKQPTQRTDFADRITTMKWYNRAVTNDGEWEKQFTQAEINAWEQAYAEGNIGPYNDYFPVIDWWDELIKDYGMSQNYNLNIRGGNQYVKYFTSIGYLKDGDIIDVQEQADYDPRYYYDRYNWRSNFDFTLTSTTTLSLNLSGSYSIKNQPNVGGGINQYFNNLYSVSPSDFPITWDDGTFGTSREGLGNISHLVYQGQEQFKEFRGFVDTKIIQKLDFVTKGLMVTGRFSYNSNSKTKTTINMFAGSGTVMSKFGDNNTIDNYHKEFDYANPNPDGTYPVVDSVRYPTDPEFLGSVPGVNKDAWDGYSRRIYGEVRIDYARTFGKHDVTAMFSNNFNQRNVGSEIPYRLADYVGRVTYGYDRKYLLEINGSYNGSENFAPGKRFEYFPSASVGWRISEEPFVRDAIGKVLTNLKVRYSIGQSGKENIGNDDRFLYIPRFEAQDANEYKLFLGENSRNRVGILYTEGDPANENATWETSTKQNMGFEFGLFNHFNGTVDLFKEKRTGILMDRWLAMWINSKQGNANLGETKNHGFEIDLNYSNRIGQNFRYGFNGNMMIVENRIVKRNDGPNTFDYERQAGKPINFQRRYVAHSYYQDLDDIYNGPVTGDADLVQSKLLPGDILYVDYNGDGKITIGEQDQAVMQGQNKPFKTYSFGMNMSYKGFAFSMRFYGIWDVYSNIPDRILYDFQSANNGLYSAKPDVIYSWTPENGDKAVKPVLHTDGGVVGYSRKESNWTYQDRSYLRLKNVELGYTFKNINMASYTLPMLNVYVNGNNLYTWTDFNKLLDPESEGTNAYPMIRRINVGLTATF